MKKYLLFDLDGTLTDPKEGITTCVQYGLHSIGIEEPDLDKLECFIGPPLKDSFEEFYGLTPEQTECAIAKYRERFTKTGIFENTMYKGIPKMLKTLQKSGMHLAVASSKPTYFVEKILEHFGIRGYFEVVVGSELDGRRGKKEEVVAEALRQLFDGGKIRTDEVYMIGDTKYDVEGAHACGIEAVAVAYGYGSYESLLEAKADYIVVNVAQLQNFLMRPIVEKEAAKPTNTIQKLWGIAFPIVMFLAVRLLLLAGMTTVATALVGVSFVESQGFSLLTTLLSYLGAGAAVLPVAKRAVWFATEDRKLLYIMPRPVSSYLLLAGATVGSVLGLNLLLGLTGLTDKYIGAGQNTTQWTGVMLLVAVLVFGVVTPLAEEILFRGILYNRMRRWMTALPSIVLSAALFGIYHGNVLQAAYAALLGALIAYGYEYFGSFRVPVVMHMGANLAALLCPFALLQGVLGWIVCACSIVVSVVCIAILVQRV